MHLAITIALLTTLALGCEKAPVVSSTTATSPTATVATPLLDKFQCARCHEIPNVAPAPHDLNCRGCHNAIFDGFYDDRDPDEVARWKTRVKSLREVPTLVGVSRLRSDWLIEFLQNPHDLRPGIDASMPRMPIDATTAKRLEAELRLADGARTVEKAPAGDVARGRELFRERACGECHTFSGTRVKGLAATATPEQRMAPDLRIARQRLDQEMVFAWISDPKSIKADTLMPVLAPQPQDAADLAAFVVEAELAPVAAAESPEIPAPLDRPVSWEEVDGKLLSQICRHCHGPRLDEGGPGNTGGFGYPGRQLSLVDYEGIKMGSVAPDGTRTDLLKRDKDGVAPLTRHLMARHYEVAGRPSDTLGMPLGLPPIPLQTIALVRAWIAQGVPGPK